MPSFSLVHTTDRNMALARVGHLIVNVGGHAPFTDAAVDDLLRLEKPLLAAIPTTEKVGLVAWTAHGPNNRQRTRLAESQMMTRVSFALMLSDSTFVRGAATALNWIVRSHFKARFLATNSRDEGIAWLRENVEFDAQEASECLIACAKSVALIP